MLYISELCGLSECKEEDGCGDVRDEEELKEVSRVTFMDGIGNSNKWER